MRRFEGHLAAYPPGGAAYARHVDVHVGSRHRLISLILYLNPPDWGAADGGALRLYLPPGSAAAAAAADPAAAAAFAPVAQAPAAEEGEEAVDVRPAGGTLVVFRSEGVPHEVRPSAGRERLSLTGWLRDDDGFV